MPSTGTSFASGFVTGLADVMGQKRQDRIRQQEREQDLKMKALQHLVDTGALESGDLEHVMGTFFSEEPGAKRKKPKAGQADPQELIRNIMGAALANQQKPAPGASPTQGAADPGQLGAPQQGATPGVTPPVTPGQPETPRALPVSPFGSAPPAAVAPPSPIGSNAAVEGATAAAPATHRGGTFFGAPLYSPDEIADQTATRAANAKVLLARKVSEALIAAGMPREDSMRMAMGFSPENQYSAANRPQSVPGELADGTPAYAVFHNGKYYDADTDQPIPDFRPRTTTASATLGTVVERAAKLLGFTSASEAARKGQMEAVQTKVQELLKQDAASRVEGAGAGKQNVPLDIPGSQASGLPVGTTATNVTGQVVPTAEQRTSANVGRTLKADLDRLTGDGTPANPGLLAVLPSKNDAVGGLFPGLTSSIQSRLAKREQYAALQAVVEGMVNDLARYKGQRGAQTEGDVERAYQTLVKLNGSLMDPMGGDTRESALARIKEARRGIDIVNASIPQMPVPGAAPAKPAATAAPAAPAATGAVMRDGKLYINGVLLPGQ